MHRRRIGATLAALLLVWTCVLHAAFACSAGAHPPPPCHAGGDEAPAADAGPVCCQQLTTLAAAPESARPHDVSMAPWLVATPAVGGFEARIALPPSGFDPPPGRLPGPDPRGHRLQILNL